MPNDLLLSRARAAAAAALSGQRRAGDYFDDPVGWATDNIRWPAGEGLSSYQAEVLAALPAHKRVSFRSLHGAGKTMLMAIAVHWFAETRDRAGADWKIPTTASVWRQLTDFLWPEIHKWARLIDWNRLGRRAYRRDELLTLNLKLRTGHAMALASDNPMSIEGAHADEILYIFDESKAISDATFDAAEGAFSSGNAYALAVSTPGEPLGRFYDIHARAPGTEDWWVRHVTLDEAIEAGRVTKDWADQRALLWGVESAVYKNRVLGEFASSDEDAVIPLAWVEHANALWERIYGKRPRQRDDSRGSVRVLKGGEKLHTLGVDVARGGTDRSAIALRQGNTICEVRRLPYSDDTMVTAGVVKALQENHRMPTAIVDVIGVGGGVFDRIRELEYPCSPFNASEGTPRKDMTGEFGFNNRRSWGWWNLREMMDPGNACDVALPPDDMLTGDLVAPKWRVVAGGKIAIESKDDIRKRIGRSTDTGDCVMQALTESGASWATVYKPAEIPEDEADVPQPRDKPARSGGWGSVYAKGGTDPASDERTADPPPAPGSWGDVFGRPKREAPRSGWLPGMEPPEKR